MSSAAWVTQSGKSHERRALTTIRTSCSNDNPVEGINDDTKKVTTKKDNKSKVSQPKPLTTNRRRALYQFLGSTTTLIFNGNLRDDAASAFRHHTAFAAETIGKDPNCNDPSCLGVWDGLFADCPHNDKMFGSSTLFDSGSAGCTSSQDDTPGIFSEPWDYSDSLSYISSDDNDNYWKEQMRLLKTSISLVSSKRGDQVTFLLEEGRYLRTRFIDSSTGEVSIGEFYFTPNDTTVQFRVASSSSSNDIGSDTSKRIKTLVGRSKSNIERCEDIRKQARYTKIPVLRNRQRILFFGESNLDTFGPGSASIGPPAEMSTGDIEGRQDLSTCDKNGYKCLPFGMKLK